MSFKIKKIIFDYGGVVSLISRKDIIVKILSDGNPEYKSNLEKLFKSEKILHFARGKIPKEEIYKSISSIINSQDFAYINSVFEISCIPSLEMKEIIGELREKYKLFLISDSLPPFSAYINKEFHCIFDELFFSDVYKCRKSEGLFHKIHLLNKNIFKNSLYIDDKKEYLEIPEKLGASCLQFKSPVIFREELKNLKVL